MFQTRIKLLRCKNNLSQQDMADVLGISVRSYQRYETHKQFCAPSVETLIKIADYFDVSLDYLVGRDKYLNSHEASADEHQ